MSKGRVVLNDSFASTPIWIRQPDKLREKYIPDFGRVVDYSSRIVRRSPVTGPASKLSIGGDTGASPEGWIVKA
jgi:hypothetical protein